MHAGRVVEILAAREGRRGSGYLVTDGLVLTAGHVVDDTPEDAFRVRALGTADWTSARRVWRGVCDAALLELAEPGRVGSPARLGRIAGSAAVAISGVGFPDAQAIDQPDV